MCGVLEDEGKGRAPLSVRFLTFSAQNAWAHIQTLSVGWPLASTSPRLKRGNVCSADCSRSGSLNGMVESVSSACATVGQSISRSPSEVCISMVPARKESVRAPSNRRQASAPGNYLLAQSHTNSCLGAEKAAAHFGLNWLMRQQ